MARSYANQTALFEKIFEFEFRAMNAPPDKRRRLVISFALSCGFEIGGLFTSVVCYFFVFYKSIKT